MLSAKFDPSSFFQITEHAALHVAAEEIFSLLVRSLDLPPTWSALVKRISGEQSITLPGGRIDGTNAADVLFVRTTPIDVSQSVEGLLSADRFACRADIRLLVTLHPDRSELTSFARTILGSRRVAKAETLTAYLQPGIQAALAQFAAARDASQLIDGALNDESAANLRNALAGPCFTAGLTIDAAPRVSFTSPALAQARQVESENSRRRAEHAAAGELLAARRQTQSQHVAHVSSMLDKLRDMTAATPDVPFADLIRTFSEQQRGDVYQALFAGDASAARTQWIVTATADEILFFDAVSPDRPARRLRVAGPPGPARSVQTSLADGAPALLIGAARGLYRFPVDRSEPDLILTVPDAPAVRGGFNAAVQVGSRIFASHSELGICAWDVSASAAPRRLFAALTAGAKAVREIKAQHQDVYCCLDNRVIQWNAGDTSENPHRIYTGSANTLTSICPAYSGLYAGTSEGEVLHWPVGAYARPVCLHRGSARPVESLWLLSAQGVDRLFYTDTTLHVHCRVLGDNFLCRYEAGGQTIRRVEVAGDRLVGVSDTRDRLFVWPTGDPSGPAQVIPIHRLAGQSVQDVCLI